jgi:uncharacterized protein
VSADQTTPDPSLDARAGAMSRRSFLKLLGIGAVTALTAPAVASSYDFEIQDVTLPLRGLAEPLRVTWLVDLHFGPFIREGSVRSWVDETIALAPDLVLLGGDVVDRFAPADLTPLLDQLGRLAAPLGVFAVRGNHEYARFDDAPGDFDAALEELGIATLVNGGVVIRDDLYLAGVDDLNRGTARLPRALTDRPAGAACLLMSHTPDLLPDVPMSVGLTLCGHTHGGQVVPPGVGPVFTSSRYGRRFVAGIVHGPAAGYVSRGLGVGHLPLRVNCPAELTLLTLLPDDGGDGA